MGSRTKLSNLKPTAAKLVRAWPCAASAALLLLAFPPFNLGLLVFVAFVPWLVSLRKTDGRAAWRSGYTFGFFYGLGQLLWIGQLANHWIGNVLMAAIAWLLACAIFALYFGWTGVLIRHAWARGWPWAIPLVWTGIEVFRSFIPTFAFPYAIVATPLWPYTGIIQTAHYGSIFFVTAWVLLVNTMVAMWLCGEGYMQTRRYISVALAVLAMSLVALGLTVPSKPLIVTMVQPGVDMAFDTPENQQAGLRKNVNLILSMAEHDGTQLLVLPEGIADGSTMPPGTPFRLPKDIPIIFGGARGTPPGPIYQSAFAFDGVRWQYVDKTRLVVFGEFVPGRILLSWIVKGYRLPDADLSVGRHGVQAVNLAGITVGPVVCFEALFPDVAYKQALNGARLLAVIGIDDWFMDGAAPDQLRAASIWRAVETGLPLVRATTQGYTLACDGKGHILAEAPLRNPAGLRIPVPIPDQSPLFHALPVFPALVLLFSLVFPWARMPFSERSEPENEKGGS